MEIQQAHDKELDGLKNIINDLAKFLKDVTTKIRTPGRKDVTTQLTETIDEYLHKDEVTSILKEYENENEDVNEDEKIAIFVFLGCWR